MRRIRPAFFFIVVGFLVIAPFASCGVILRAGAEEETNSPINLLFGISPVPYSSASSDALQAQIVYGNRSSYSVVTNASYVVSAVTTPRTEKTSNWLYLFGGIASGVGVAAAGNALSGSGASSVTQVTGSGSESTTLNPLLGARIRKTGESAVKFLYHRVIALAGLKEIQMLGTQPQVESPVIFGLSRRELYVIGISVPLFALAFIIAGNLNIQVVNIILFLLMGATAVLGHELLTNLMARNFQCPAEFQFWGLGTVILLLNAAVFHVTFGKPSRTIVEDLKYLEPGEVVAVSLAGPTVNVALAIVSSLLIPSGGIIGLAGTIGLSINVVLAMYSMIPVYPMKGKAIYDWNKLAWALCFLPMMGLYLWVYLIP